MVSWYPELTYQMGNLDNCWQGTLFLGTQWTFAWCTSHSVDTNLLNCAPGHTSRTALIFAQKSWQHQDHQQKVYYRGWTAGLLVPGVWAAWAIIKYCNHPQCQLYSTILQLQSIPLPPQPLWGLLTPYTYCWANWVVCVVLRPGQGLFLIWTCFLR